MDLLLSTDVVPRSFDQTGKEKGLCMRWFRGSEWVGCETAPSSTVSGGALSTERSRHKGKEMSTGPACSRRASLRAQKA